MKRRGFFTRLALGIAAAPSIAKAAAKPDFCIPDPGMDPKPYSKTYTRAEWEVELRARLDDGRYTAKHYATQLEHSRNSKKIYEIDVILGAT